MDVSTAQMRGKVRMERYKEEASMFRNKLKGFLDSILKGVDMEIVKIYQDGISVGGDRGVKVIKHYARRGNKNFQIVSSLISRGATLQHTEDAQLLKKNTIS